MEKIIHVCQSDIGGTTEYIYMFLKNIDKNKYENILICPSSGCIRKKISSLGIKIYVLEMTRKISVFKDFQDIRKIRKIIKKEQPNILFLHSSKAGALGRIARIGIKNLKVLYNPHGWAFNMEGSSRKKIFYGVIEKFLSYFTDIIINISKDEYETAIKRKIPVKKMVVIKNGIEIEKYKENKKEKFLDKYVIGFVGRLSEQKNPLFLVEIAKELLNKK
ncbi:MAG: glycosyltransferase [Fusobacterium ulcerans]|uniref:glycosyltransferase n=1 Tax=Fusobacterium ulcerans TaxID=861 RepID=UPI003A85A6C0